MGASIGGQALGALGLQAVLAGAPLAERAELWSWGWAPWAGLWRADVKQVASTLPGFASVLDRPEEAGWGEAGRHSLSP